MKKNTIPGLIFASISFYSQASTAEDKYPAANFEPQVIFVDKTAVTQSSEQVTDQTDSRYPAANFQPQVVYIDKNVTEQTTVSSDEIDPKYPAANFKPRVIYP